MLELEGKPSRSTVQHLNYINDDWDLVSNARVTRDRRRRAEITSYHRHSHQTQKIAGHFRHSSLANERLHQMQDTYKCAVNKMVQDVATRWDSTNNMVNKAVEQKKALVGYDSEFGLPERLSSNE